jgi:hypothetical protein
MTVSLASSEVLVAAALKSGVSPWDGGICAHEAKPSINKKHGMALKIPWVILVCFAISFTLKNYRSYVLQETYPVLATVKIDAKS